MSFDTRGVRLGVRGIFQQISPGCFADEFVAFDEPFNHRGKRWGPFRGGSFFKQQRSVGRVHGENFSIGHFSSRHSLTCWLHLRRVQFHRLSSAATCAPLARDLAPVKLARRRALLILLCIFLRRRRRRPRPFFFSTLHPPALLRHCAFGRATFACVFGFYRVFVALIWGSGAGKRGVREWARALGGRFWVGGEWLSSAWACVCVCVCVYVVI